MIVELLASDLNQGVIFVLQGSFNSAWKYFWLSQLGEGGC